MDRQWQALERCFELFSALTDYPEVSYVFRLGDDLAILDRFVANFWSTSMKEGVHVQNCEHTGGLSGTAAMVKGSESVRNYFTQPMQLVRDSSDSFSQVMSVQNPQTKHPMNPESLFMWKSLKLSDTEVHYTDTFPVVEGTVLQDAKKQLHLCYKSRQIENCLSRSVQTLLKDRSVAIVNHSKEVYACEGPNLAR